jgi:outer membrane protein insertion porin family
MNLTKDKRWVIIVLGLMTFMTACNTTKHLPKDASLVKKNQIVFKSADDVKTKTKIADELLSFIKQKPNSNFMFFIPREWLYVNNFKAQGEEPVIFSDSLARKSAKDMENYLKFKKGYYHAIVDYIVDQKSHLTGFESTSGNSTWEVNNSYVTYLVALNNRYKIKSLKYESDDTKLLEYIESIKDASYVKPGDFVNFDAFEQEKLRLTLSLQNKGYQGFSPNYIEVSGDSSQVNRNVDIFIKIRTPANSLHTKYTVGTVSVYTDYVKDANGLKLIKESIGSATYYRQSRKYLVSPTLLQKKISLNPGMLLRKDDRTTTFRQLSNLSTYRFVTINTSKDVINDSLMNFDIILTPHANRWTIDGELGAYLSTLNNQYLWGLKLASLLQNRNTFGGSEIYSLRAEVGSEFGRSNTSFFVPRTANILLQNSLTFPSFRDYLGMGKLTKVTGIIPKKYFVPFTNEAVTDVQVGFNYFNILDFYNFRTINATYGYEYNTVKNNRYIFKPFGVNFDIYNIVDSARFEGNPLGILAFRDNLGTGFLFREFTFLLNRPKDKSGRVISFYNSFELSGLEVDLINKAYNTVTGETGEWKIHSSRDIKFAKYVREEMDLRIRKEYTKNKTFAMRFNLGIIVPFGSDAVAPFIKQFNAGGPNSMRGWRLRALGPGGYRPPNDFLADIPTFFDNQGDFKLEINAEYRFKLIYFFEGAIFTDIGNVWALKRDVNRPLAHISSQFYTQLGVAAGWGLRLNFDYFVIRFDFGYKVRSPYLDARSGSYWYSRSDLASQGIGNVQVAVNFPF